MQVTSPSSYFTRMKTTRCLTFNSTELNQSKCVILSRRTKFNLLTNKTVLIEDNSQFIHICHDKTNSNIASISILISFNVENDNHLTTFTVLYNFISASESVYFLISSSSKYQSLILMLMIENRASTKVQ